MNSSHIVLQDGRKLAYAQFGKPESVHKMLYFHGTPSSRLEPNAWLAAYPNLDVHLVSVDRPGMGESTLHASATILAWPSDILQLVDSLQWSRFGLVAVSGGAPYGIACAREINPSRLILVGIACGTAPGEIGLAQVAWGQRLSWWATRNLPFMVRPFIKLTFVKAAKDPRKETLKGLIEAGLDASRMIEPPEVIRKIDVDLFTEAVREAFLQGGEGYVQESFLMVRPWGFALESVKEPSRILMWYGEKDDITPAIMGRKMCEKLQAEIKIFPELGHGGVFASVGSLIKEMIERDEQKYS